jgi:single-strand DNA-binding protein
MQHYKEMISMSNTEQTTITGLVATTPRHLVTQDGLPITSFRIASSQRRFDRVQNKWVDGETNWYTITAFRTLAINMAGSINKGDRILVQGELRVRDWDNGERAGTSVEIEATAVGHDLTWGTSTFTRTTLVRDEERPADVPVVEAPKHSCNCEKCDK